jgi:hypothetical protein
VAGAPGSAPLSIAYQRLPVLGTVRLAASAQGICAIALVDWHDPELWLDHWQGSAIREAITPLAERAFAEL